MKNLRQKRVRPHSSLDAKQLPTGRIIETEQQKRRARDQEDTKQERKKAILSFDRGEFMNFIAASDQLAQSMAKNYS